MNAPFTLHKWPFDFSTLKTYHCLSIDPGIKNFCIRVERVGKRVSTVSMDLIHLKKRTYDDIAMILNGYNLAKVRLVVIEKQLVQSVKMANIAKNVISYCVCRLNAIVIEVDAKLKCKLFDCPPGTKGKALDDWEIDKATKLLKKEGDCYGLECINDSDKKDDKAVTALQSKAVRFWLSDPDNEHLLRKKTKLFDN